MTSRSAQIDVEADMALVAAHLKQRARYGWTTGRLENPWEQQYLDSCRVFHEPTGSLVLFTRDTGHHTSGWMKNPDYERCLHLSLSFREVVGPRWSPRPRDKKLSALWLRMFFGDDAPLAWAESPKSQSGKILDVWHWRLFCDPSWAAFHPRGEVYSTDFTEKGWRSASQVMEEDGVLIESILDPG